MNSRTAATNPVAHERDLDVLTLIARLPLISARQLGQILGDRRAVYRRLRQVRRCGLVATVGWQPRGTGRPAELLRVTPRARRMLAEHAATSHTEPLPAPPRGAVKPHQLAIVLACYELLTELARTEADAQR
jgi:predicted ArsR family transcriptional regulator